MCWVCLRVLCAQQHTERPLPCINGAVSDVIKAKVGCLNLALQLRLMRCIVETSRILDEVFSLRGRSFSSTVSETHDMYVCVRSLMLDVC